MKFLVLLTPAAGKKTEDVAPHMVAEVKSVWSSYMAGTLREFYFSAGPPTVTLIYEVFSMASLIDELDRLPLIKAGLLDRQIVELAPFPQLEVLFDKRLFQPD